MPILYREENCQIQWQQDVKNCQTSSLIGHHFPKIEIFCYSSHFTYARSGSQENVSKFICLQLKVSFW